MPGMSTAPLDWRSNPAHLAAQILREQGEDVDPAVEAELAAFCDEEVTVPPAADPQ